MPSSTARVNPFDPTSRAALPRAGPVETSSSTPSALAGIDTPGALSFDDYLVGEQHQLLGRSMAEKEVYLGVQVQTRTMVDRAVERAAPVLRWVFPAAVDAELVALDAEVEHLDGVIGTAGLEGRSVTAEEMSWLMHRSCSLGLPAPRNLPTAPGSAWEPEDLASFTDTADFHAEPYSPTLTIREDHQSHPQRMGTHPHGSRVGRGQGR